MRRSRDLHNIHNIHNITGFKFVLHVKLHDETHVLVITHNVHYICVSTTYRHIPSTDIYLNRIGTYYKYNSIK